MYNIIFFLMNVLTLHDSIFVLRDRPSIIYKNEFYIRMFIKLQETTWYLYEDPHLDILIYTPNIV